MPINPSMRLVKPGKLVYPNVGVLESTDDEAYLSMAIEYAYKNDNGSELVVVYSGDIEDSFTLKEGKIEPYNKGFVTFSSDRGDFQIRPFTESDGYWVSDYQMDVPKSVAIKLAVDAEGNDNMPYLEDQRESLMAFQLPEDDYIYGLLYVTKYGPFIRKNGSWLGVSPNDETFDDTTPYKVNAETASELVEMFDKGNLTAEVAMPYITQVGDAQ